MAAGMQISSRGQIQSVMPLLLKMEKDKNDYLPEGVSFGPYHHGDTKLAVVEAFKPMAVDLFVSGGPQNKEFYYNKVLHIIGEVRSCYIHTRKKEFTLMKEEFTDAELAEMMLKDASLIIMYMEISAPAKAQEVDHRVREKFISIKEHLGMLAFSVLSRDLYLLDNQIPLFAIKLLVDLRDGAGRGDELVDRFLYMSFFGEYPDESLQRGGEPLHLLEASHRLLTVGGDKASVEKESGHGDPETGQPASRTGNKNNGLFPVLQKLLGCKKSGDSDKSNIKSLIPIFRAATDLKAKGIHFRPSPTQFLSDASLDHHLLYATLRLPQYGVSTRTKVFLKNMVAYELSPGSPTRCEIISYINLMKSLLERPEDVKELREKRIIHNMLGSDEEVLAVFKDISTHGISGTLFKHVNDHIRGHCNNRMKTWVAEFIYTYFRSPWTLIALLAAATLLGFTAAQVHYAVHPNS